MDVEGRGRPGRDGSLRSRRKSSSRLPKAIAWAATLAFGAVATSSSFGCRPTDSRSSGGLSGDPNQDDCGFEIQTSSLSGDPCTDGVLVVPPTVHTRTRGSSNVSASDFVTQQAGVACVQILNGTGDRGEAVSAAKIRLDGEVILSGSAFGPGREASRHRVHIDAGPHVLQVELDGKPDTKLTASVRFGSDAMAENASFAFVKLYASPLSFSPDGNGIFDTTDLRATVDADTSLPGNTGHNKSFEMRNVGFEIADGATCQATRSLPIGALSIHPGEPTRVSVTWEGTDEDGNVLAAGKYFFRVSGTLYRTGAEDQLIASHESQVASLRIIDDPSGETQEEGVTIKVDPGPPPAPNRLLPVLSIRDVAIRRLQEQADHIDVAFRGRLTATSVQSRTVVYTTGSGSLHYIVGQFQVLETWKSDGGLGSTALFAVPLTTQAPRFANGQEYAVLGSRSGSELHDIDSDASLLPFVDAGNVELMRERFDEATVRSLTQTGGTP